MNGPKHILIVDPDKDSRLHLSQWLEEGGYQITTAVDGEHALSKIPEHRIDLILLALKLPGMDGLKVLHKIKLINPKQIVVIITAHGTIETAVEAMKLGAADYLQKPFTAEEICAIVHCHFNSSLCGASTLEEENYEVYIKKARETLDAKEYDRTRSLLRKAINLDPERAEAFNLIGVAYEFQGNFQVAQKMYGLTVAVDPEYEPASINLQRICNWKNNIDSIDMGKPKN